MAASGGEVKLSSRQARKCAALGKILGKEEAKIRFKKVERIWKKEEKERTLSETEFLEESKDDVAILKKRAKLKGQKLERDLEVEDEPDILEEKCSRLADAISAARRVIVYTGAGISTAASIPDYRGPNGVWTLLKKGKSISAQDLSCAEPTLTHMTLVELYRHGYINYVVSQNCDGLHLRSGFPRTKLSEVHGNMFIEMCTACQPPREYVRLFDVTEKTARHRHKTTRQCKKCKGPLRDSIIHFGEKGPLRGPPYNWMKARNSADRADLILCLGSSLKVLRKYQELWAMDKPKQDRPLLYIVNLQWTPKDDSAALKINGRCDEVMLTVAKRLGIEVPSYDSSLDPLFYLHTPLTKKEVTSTTRRILSVPDNFVPPPRVAHRRRRALPPSHIACKVSKVELDQVSGVTLGENDDDGIKLEIKTENVKVKIECDREFYSGDIPALPDHTYAHRLTDSDRILHDEKLEHSSCLTSLSDTVLNKNEDMVALHDSRIACDEPPLQVETPALQTVSDGPVVRTCNDNTPAHVHCDSAAVPAACDSAPIDAALESNDSVPCDETTLPAAEDGEQINNDLSGDRTEDPLAVDSGISLAENSELGRKEETDPAEKDEIPPAVQASRASVYQHLGSPVRASLTAPLTINTSPKQLVMPAVRPVMNPFMALPNGARVMPPQFSPGGAIMTPSGLLMPGMTGMMPGVTPGLVPGVVPMPGGQYVQPLLQNGLLQPSLNQMMNVPLGLPMVHRLPLVSSHPLPANVMGPGCHLHTLQYQYLDPRLIQRPVIPVQTPMMTVLNPNMMMNPGGSLLAQQQHQLLLNSKCNPVHNAEPEQSPLVSCDSTADLNKSNLYVHEKSSPPEVADKIKTSKADGCSEKVVDCLDNTVEGPGIVDCPREVKMTFDNVVDVGTEPLDKTEMCNPSLENLVATTISTMDASKTDPTSTEKETVVESGDIVAESANLPESPAITIVDEPIAGAVQKTRSTDSRSSSSPDSVRSSDSPMSAPGWFGKGLRIRKKRQSKS